MNNIEYIKKDVVIVGGGPAGLGAALSLSNSKGKNILLVERNDRLGGILNQCIHEGFGLHYLKKSLTGPEYAEHFINLVSSKENVDILLDTMVLSINNKLEIVASKKGKIFKITANAIILAMGCREKTAGNIQLPGPKLSGIMTAGTAQYLMNMKNVKIGSKALIVGSGDIGLIMARRLTIENIEVVGVVEIQRTSNGLERNVIQCLDDFGIPLRLRTGIKNIKGKDRLESITVVDLDDNQEEIPGSEHIINVDTLLLSVGLIPELDIVELLKDSSTGGPIVNENYMTSIEGIFACGNVLHVHDLVDNVTVEASSVGDCVNKYLEKSISKKRKTLELKIDDNIRYILPQKVFDTGEEKKFFLRVNKEIDNGILVIRQDEKIIYESKVMKLRPSEMVSINIVLDNFKDDIVIGVIER